MRTQTAHWRTALSSTAMLVCGVSCMAFPATAQNSTQLSPQADQPASETSDTTKTGVSQDDLIAEVQLVRRQNDALRTQVDLLERERDLLIRQIQFLQQVLLDNDLLDEMIARTNAPVSQPAGPASTDAAIESQQRESGQINDAMESRFDPTEWADADPFSSPWALRAAVVRSYAEHLSNIPRSTPREEDLFHDAVARWTRTTSRELRSQVDWVVALERVERDDRNARRYSGVLRVVDPATGIGVGSSLVVPVPERYAIRVIRAPEVSYWDMRAEIIAEPRYNPDRHERGIFDEPPIIGPFAEHGWKLVWRNLQPWRAPDEAQER